MSGRLRQLGPLPLGTGVTPPLPTPAQRLGYKVAVLAVMVQFVISPNLLMMVGIDYNAIGGNPLVKLHPATYLAGIAACLAVCGSRPAGSALTNLFRSSPALALFLVLIPACAFYSIACVGFSGSAIYIDTYLSAGMIVLALQNGTDLQHRFLARMIIAWCVLNVLISVGETLTQTHLVPEPQYAELIPKEQEDFRGAALFGHPLTGALVTALSIFLLLGMRAGVVVKSALFTTLMIGLLAYSGRAAMGTTLVLLAGGAVIAVFRGLLHRKLSGGLVAALLATVFLLLPLLIVVITGTSIGDRLVSHLYADDSVDARSIQWFVLDRLNLHDVLFGVTPTRLEMLKYQIGLGATDTDIENFWLLMFLDLGIIGFVVWVVALGLFLLHLGRRTGSPYGWLMMLAFILIDSTANSLGRKCADLVFLSALMIGLSGYRQAQAAAAPAARLVLHRFARRRLPIGAAGQRALSRILLPRNPPAPMAGIKP
jgi:hypothetical protein